MTNSIEKFWTKVDKSNDCWLFLGGSQYQIDGKRYSAKKLAYREVTGKETTLSLRPSCGNESCINPDHMVPHSQHTLFERFMDKVDVGADCWLWTGSKTPLGYGKIGYMGQSDYAHRISYQLFNGPVGNLYVCHSCDVPSCVNPEHLWLGTQADNMADRDAKGRGNAGKKIQRARKDTE